MLILKNMIPWSLLLTNIVVPSSKIVNVKERLLMVLTKLGNTHMPMEIKNVGMEISLNY